MRSHSASQLDDGHHSNLGAEKRKSIYVKKTSISRLFLFCRLSSKAIYPQWWGVVHGLEGVYLPRAARKSTVNISASITFALFDCLTSYNRNTGGGGGGDDRHIRGNQIQMLPSGWSRESRGRRFRRCLWNGRHMKTFPGNSWQHKLQSPS